MPRFTKKSLSLFLRNGCEKQFVLSLYKDTERKTHNLPPRQTTRAALGLVAEAGYDWQDEKVNELKDVFGDANVHVNPVFSGKRQAEIDLLEKLPSVKEFQFVVEGKYAADTVTFRNALDIGKFKDYFNNPVSIGDTQPDIVQILPALNSTREKFITQNDAYQLAVLPDGKTERLAENDNRLRLRVIDIKLTSEPGAHYFAEVVYYSMTLAAWMIENNLNDSFVVIAAPAIWAGSHEASNLVKQMTEWRKKFYAPTAAEMFSVLEEDLEIAPFEVFAAPLRRILTEQLPAMLAQNWEDLSWHVDFRCKGCEFLGYPWIDKDGNVDNDPRQCYPTAERNAHLSQVVGLSRGATKHLTSLDVKTLETLADTNPASAIFEEHQSLRAKRTIFPHRADALRKRATFVIPHSGGDALMPRFPNLHIYLFLDYDLSSAITAAIGVRAFWLEPLPFGSQLEAETKAWTQKKGADEVFLIDQRSLERERDEFLKFLRHLKKILAEVREFDEKAVATKRRDNPLNEKDTRYYHSSYQIYLWDEAQRKHLVRLIGRHLTHILADADLKSLAWLFPPPELLQHAEDATRKSPITIVSTVINNVIALPVVHHYSLLDVVKTYKPDALAAPIVHPLYLEPMSDLVPAERIHEWWTRDKRRDWHDVQTTIRETSQKKVYALNLVASRLESDLKDVLSRQAAPDVLTEPKGIGKKIAPQSQMWYEFTQLNAALKSLDLHTIRAMPPHEREATTKSARLTRRLSGNERQIAIGLLSRSIGRELTDNETLFIYELRDGSLEINARPGDFPFALSPEQKQTSQGSFESRQGFLDESPFSYVEGTSLQNAVNRRNPTFESLKWTEVSVEAIDRPNRLIALRGNYNCNILQLENEMRNHTDAEKRLDFSKNVILDKIHDEFLTSKLKLTLKDIANPPNAVPDVRTLEALGLPPNYPVGKSPITFASEILWETQKIHAQKTNRDVRQIRENLELELKKASRNLNDSQWRAWENALERRFSIIWGPPGTGKSQTLRTIILGAVLDALENQKPLRLLITANTNTAVDNVLLDAERDLARLLSAEKYKIYRVQSDRQNVSDEMSKNHPTLKQICLSKSSPSEEINALRDELTLPTEISIVGILPQQLHNLAIVGQRNPPKSKATLKEWFDFVVLDEASQMDIASATLIFTKIAANSTCVLAGDDLQLPPIQPATPPLNLEHLVGSTYNYFRHYQDIEPNSLNVNYRSNATIVELTKLAGYSSALVSNSPDLKINLLGGLSAEKPSDFPAPLVWSANFGEMLNAKHATVCFVYDDDASGQTNDFEADNTASLVWLLQKHLSNKLLNEKLPDGSFDTIVSNEIYTTDEFWQKAVGIVTPHRSQMSKIVGRLQQIFPTQNAEAIRGAVDTVERFQGQQRDIIIASFGLGDVDIISAEDEFLYSINRFNVLSSRSRAKLIVFVTRTFLEHLSGDTDVLEESRFLKQFADSFCDQSKLVTFGFIKNGVEIIRSGSLRRR